MVNDGREFLHNRPLREWRDILPDVFKVLDRSTIVNLREIEMIKENAGKSVCQVVFRKSSHQLSLGAVAAKALRGVL